MRSTVICSGLRAIWEIVDSPEASQFWTIGTVVEKYESRVCLGFLIGLGVVAVVGDFLLRTIFSVMVVVEDEK